MLLGGSLRNVECLLVPQTQLAPLQLSWSLGSCALFSIGSSALRSLLHLFFFGLVGLSVYQVHKSVCGLTVIIVKAATTVMQSTKKKKIKSFLHLRELPFLPF